MARKLEDIFNECYERMRSGESLKSCLKRYPKHAVELEPLLKTAFDIGRRASYIQPRPEFKHWALVRAEGAQHHARQQRQPAKPSLFSWRQSWGVAVAVVLILLLTGSSTAIASSNAMPDEPLYPVKLATEEMRLTFAISDVQKAQVHTQLAETRAVEVETMADQGKTEYAVIAAEKLANQLEQANIAMANMESTTGTAPLSTTTEEQPPVTEEQQTLTEKQPPVTEEQPSVTEEQPSSPPTTPQNIGVTDKTEHFKKSLESSTSKSLTALESALEKAPPQAKSDLQRAIDIISEGSKGTDENMPPPVWPSQPPAQSDNETLNEELPAWPSQPPAQSDNETSNEELPAWPSQPPAQSDNETWNEELPAWPSQPPAQSDNETWNEELPAPVRPNRHPAHSDNKTWNEGTPNPSSHSNDQASSSERQNTGDKD
jgi:hypothetical protein